MTTVTKPKKITKFIYNPPKYKGKSCWCPVVVKNRDVLIGYIKGFDFVMDIIQSVSGNAPSLSIALDSSRFNDIMPNGKRLSDMTDTEKEKYTAELCTEKANSIPDETVPQSETDVVLPFLEIVCPCCNIPYRFERECDVPKNNFTCSTCGYPLLQYTGLNDSTFIFDEGESNE